MPGMEEFSLLSISGPRLSPPLSTLPDVTSSHTTSLPGPELGVRCTEEPGHPGERIFPKRHPDNAKTVPSEPATFLHTPMPQGHSSFAHHSVDSSVLTPDRLLGHVQTGEPRRRCTIYRPWFSPYSYFVCTDKGSRLEAPGFREAPWDEGRGDGWPAEDAGAESLCSSSSSPDNACAPHVASQCACPDSVTSQDILAACHWQLIQQSGYKCAACCRLYPTLHSLRSHIRGGAREGFSCGVYYRKLKSLWGTSGQPCP